MDWGRWRGREAGAAERIAHAAAPLLIVRTGEGLAAWIFFNEFFWSPTPFRWMVQAAFVGYFLLNLLVTLRERRGSVSTSLFSLDIAANVATLALPVAASGGLASPLLLLFPLKALHYAMVFGVAAAGVLLASTVAMLAIVETALPVTHLATDTAATVMEVAVLGFLIGAPAAMAWLATSLAEGPPRRPPRRLEQEATSTAVAEALLKVSEAVSRLTRLDEILEKVVEIAPHSVDVDECGLALWAEDTGTYTGVVASGGGKAIDGRFAGLHFSPEEAHDFEWVRRLGHCAVVPAPEGGGSSATNVPAVLIAPLLSGARFYGVMEFARDSARRPFNQRDLTIADGIARQTAVALERARLIEDSRRLVLAVESTEEAVLITDANRRVMFANLAFMRTFGYRREELIGRDASDLAGEDRAWLPEVQETMHRRSWRGETVAYGKNGVAIPILLNVSLIRGDDGRVQGAVAIMEDISAEKTFQAQMQRADRLAAVGEMAAGIAHEINNALAVIFGQTQNTAPRGEVELRSALERVDAQAGRIAEIVQGVLGFARPRPPRPEPLDLAALTVKTLDLVRHDLDRQGVKVSTDFDLDLPRAQADPQQVQQVLLNLFGNALQAMAGGAGAHLHIEVLGVDDRLAVRVTDDGPGIASETLPRIFDPFFSTKPEGTGLGLSVSYAIAQAHGGDLRVQSEKGLGTTFTLFLPIAAPREEEVLERILLVDDDPEVAEAIAAMLTKEGLEVSRASTGREALQMLATAAWDGIFLDVRLPDLSGPDVYAELERSHPELAQRVVFVTGGVWRSESRLRQQLPAQPVLAKPCTQDQVRNVLRRLRAQRPQAA